jgi:hypothetical protein
VSAITYITGPSCAGKTTLGKALVAHAQVSTAVGLGARVAPLWRDVDEHASQRPQTAWLDWLRWQAAEALHDATDVEGHIVYTGIVWPTHLIQSPAWRPAMKAGVEVRFLFLDWRWRVLRARLDERLAGETAKERRETIAYNRGLRRRLRDEVEAVRHGYVLAPDEDDSPEDLAEAVADLAGL